MASEKRDRKDVRARRMTWADTFGVVSAVAVSREEALEKNPLTRYMGRTPDANTSWYHRLLFRLFMYPQWYALIRQGVVWGVNDVDSVMVWGLPASYPPPSKSPLDKLIDTLLARLNALGARLTRTPQQTAERPLPPSHLVIRSELGRQRMKEFGQNLQSSVTQTIGERAAEMLVVEAILTRPGRRGRGYASALVRVMAEQADREGRAIWVGNSDVAVNTPSWESLGFREVGDVVVGEDNPDWGEEPVHTMLMVREPASVAPLKAKA